jgi:hypothetical protein
LAGQGPGVFFLLRSIDFFRFVTFLLEIYLSHGNLFPNGKIVEGYLVALKDS